MRIIYSGLWTYEQLGRPMPGRTGGRPITVVSPKSITYDAVTQAHFDIDEAVNADLCADLLARSGAYWVDAVGDLNIDPNWRELI